MMQTSCKDGTFVHAVGNIIHCSDGTSYVWTGYGLSGPYGMASGNCRTINEAFGIVVGLHGGSAF
ncbi:MAG: hypothetical protein HDQ88_04415 [Clostridia bacterium]|nr:hypothetical protein [Clostridia bacterium]